MISASYFLIFPALMAFAACYDCLCKRISNGLCLLLAATFFPAAIIIALPLDAMLSHVLCGVSALALGFALFAKAWIGGGDAKLFAAGALWFGWTNIVDFAGVTAIAGGFLALGVITFQMVCGRFFNSQAGWLKRDAELPYGIALAFGTLAIYPHSIWLTVHS